MNLAHLLLRQARLDPDRPAIFFGTTPWASHDQWARRSLALAQRPSAFAQRVGRALVNGMPMVLSALSTIGTVAMLWVGGHILLAGTDTLGWHWLYGQVHHLEEAVHHATGAFAGVLGWVVNTTASGSDSAPLRKRLIRLPSSRRRFLLRSCI